MWAYVVAINTGYRFRLIFADHVQLENIWQTELNILV
jgi:hypothetical protein